MLGRIWKLITLDWRRKKLFVQAYFLTGYVRYSLSRKPFKELVADLKLHRDAVSLPPLEGNSAEIARAVGWAVRTAANFTPWNSTCLVQVLAAQRMLQKNGIAGVFYLGAVNGGEVEESPTFMAHAWLKCADEFITGETGHQQYTVVSSFSWS
jgi:hypothetical protein